MSALPHRIVSDLPTSMATTTPASVGEGAREYTGFSILHIILISFGGVVFFIGIVVVIALVKSRRKFRGGNRGEPRGRSIRQTPIYVIGQDRPGRGGDNPAFCPTSEGNSSASPHRLPTYDEVMAGRVPSAPVSRPQPRSNPQPNERVAAPTSSNPTTVRRNQNETPPPDYTCTYSSCFWDEVPPPPYSSGNCGIVRAMGGGPRGSFREATLERNNSVPRHLSPNPGRAPLAVPTPTALSPAPSPVVPVRNRPLTSSGRAVAAGVLPPPSPVQRTFLTNEVPLASSSPAIPRRQPTPVPMPLPSHLGYLLSAQSEIQNTSPLNGRRWRIEVPQGHCYGNGRPSPQGGVGMQAAAPLASFDIEL